MFLLLRKKSPLQVLTINNTDFDKLRTKYIQEGRTEHDINKKIGEIQNNTGYIQVNDTRFYDEEVDVSFQNIWFGLKPSLFTSLNVC